MEIGASRTHTVVEQEARRQLEGVERIARLARADFLAVTVGDSPDAPAIVFIGWTAELVERTYPGTAIWRAAIERYLASTPNGDPGDPLVRAMARESLTRFPTLDRWLSWLDHERQRAARAGPAPPRPPRFWIGAP